MRVDAKGYPLQPDMNIYKMTSTLYVLLVMAAYINKLHVPDTGHVKSATLSRIHGSFTAAWVFFNF